MAQGRPPVTHRALVLQVRNVGEGHRVVDAWLLGHGRIGLWARNARTSKRRFAGALNPFMELLVTVTPEDNLWRLQAADVRADRQGIRDSLSAIGRAATLCRMVQALWPSGQDAAGVFEGLTVALDHLAAARLPRAAGLYPRLAQWAGLMPSLTFCGQCHRAAETQLTAPKGRPTLVCTTCAPQEQPLDAAVRAALGGARIEQEAVAARVEAIVTEWVSLFTGKKLTPWMAQALPTGP